MISGNVIPVARQEFSDKPNVPSFIDRLSNLKELRQVCRSLTILVPLFFYFLFFLILVDYYFQVSFKLKLILLLAKITQTAETEFL